MTSHALSFCGTSCLLMASGALFLPDERVLCVSDLHLGKSERWARRRGVMLPPYESRATLDRLALDLAATAPATVIALGDSFDDLQASESLDLVDRAALAAAMDGRDWVWIEGNHEGAATAHAGVHTKEHRVAGLTFRHEAEPGAEPGEVSGHWHPKFGIRGLRETARCFVTDGRRLVLPAYGAYTGGLDALHASFRALFADRALAVLTGYKALPVPLPAPRGRARAS